MIIIFCSVFDNTPRGVIKAFADASLVWERKKEVDKIRS
jgi:hypothetical protein